MVATPASIGVTNVGKRVSWGAIFAGTVVAVAVQVLLSILGIAIREASNGVKHLTG